MTRSILEACRDWQTHAEIIAATGLSKNTVSGTLAGLVASGRAEKREGPRMYRARTGTWSGAANGFKDEARCPG